jgi:hypothetical protein
MYFPFFFFFKIEDWRADARLLTLTLVLLTSASEANGV